MIFFFRAAWMKPLPLPHTAAPCSCECCLWRCSGHIWSPEHPTWQGEGWAWGLAASAGCGVGDGVPKQRPGV